MSLRPRHVAVGLAGLAYLALSQWLMTREPPSAWSAVALLGPMLALVAVGAWRAGRRAWAVAGAVLAAGLAALAASGDGIPAERLYLLEHFGIHVALALVFGSSLRGSAGSLITRLAARVHRSGLTPAMAAYTRKATVAWTVYFATMAALSAILYLAAPFNVWATFANVVTPLALVLMFVGEFVLRYRLHPEFERATMQDAIRAYTQSRRGPAARAESRSNR